MTPLEEAERNARLWHISDACRVLIGFTTNRTVEDYRSDAMLSSAIQWQLTVVGEAMNRLSKVDPSIASHVTAVPQIVAFRNRLVHDYPMTNPDDVWQILMEDIPRLLTEIRALLSS
jgi:uncharacterized protein with HEPN domain